MEFVSKVFLEHQQVAEKTITTLAEEIFRACEICHDAIEKNNKIFLFGNGGSAADAQHIAAEFVGRFVKERRSLPALALTTDTSALTAIGNDYGYDVIFSRQLEGLYQNGDVVIAISTSGNSSNVIKAVEFAKKAGLKCIGLSGKDGGKMNDLCEPNIVIPSSVTARIQEMHILIGHIICEYIDNKLC